MQTILFLSPKEGEPVDRMINLDRLATAWRADDGSTVLIVDSAQVEMGMKFEEFLEKVQALITDNYKSQAKNSALWEQSRMENLRKVMSEALDHHHTS